MTHNGTVMRKHVIVRGRVQGVGFRAGVHDQAQRLGLVGWARNRADGSVEVEAEGDHDNVDDLLEWLRTGPRGASVETVDVTDVPAMGERYFTIEF